MEEAYYFFIGSSACESDLVYGWDSWRVPLPNAFMARPAVALSPYRTTSSHSTCFTSTACPLQVPWRIAIGCGKRDDDLLDHAVAVKYSCSVSPGHVLER